MNYNNADEDRRQEEEIDISDFLLSLKSIPLMVDKKIKHNELFIKLWEAQNSGTLTFIRILMEKLNTNKKKINLMKELIEKEKAQRDEFVEHRVIEIESLTEQIDTADDLLDVSLLEETMNKYMKDVNDYVEKIIEIKKEIPDNLIITNISIS